MDAVARITYQFPSGASAEVVEPPEGFDPLKASDDELIRCGLPPRPSKGSHPDKYARWVKIVDGEIERVVPSFRLNQGKRHSPTAGKQVASESTYSSTTWSGSVVAAPANTSFDYIEGNFTVPQTRSPYLAPRPQAGTWRSAIWAGIDGFGSDKVTQAGDVLQIGLECYNYYGLASPDTAVIYPWWEWYPEDEVEIKGFPVSAGDYLSLEVVALSSATANVLIVNNTQSKQMLFSITPPSGTTLVGNCAEWIVERPLHGGATSD